MPTSNYEIAVQLEPPAADGVCEVFLAIGEEATLQGYFGPAASIRVSAEDDHIQIRGEFGAVLGVLVEVKVDEDLHRKGMGTALVNRFIQLLVENAVHAVFLYAEHSEYGMDLPAWYARFGFQRLHDGDTRPDPQMIYKLRPMD